MRISLRGCTFPIIRTSINRTIFFSFFGHRCLPRGLAAPRSQLLVTPPSKIHPPFKPCLLYTGTGRCGLPATIHDHPTFITHPHSTYTRHHDFSSFVTSGIQCGQTILRWATGATVTSPVYCILLPVAPASGARRSPAAMASSRSEPSRSFAAGRRGETVCRLIPGTAGGAGGGVY